MQTGKVTEHLVGLIQRQVDEKEIVDAIGRKVEEGLLDLTELDRLSVEAASLGTAAIKLVFQTTAVEPVALAFVSSDAYDAKIVEKKAEGELAALFQKAFGIELDPAAGLPAMRRQLAKGLLTNELLAALPAAARPEALAHLPVPDTTGQVKQIREVCAAWRNRLDYREAGATAARAVEDELALDGIEWSPEAAAILSGLQTFPAIERLLFANAERMILEGNHTGVLETAQRRQKAFWALVEPSVQIRWNLMEAAGHVMMRGGEIRSAIAGKKPSALELCQRYTGGEEAWCRLDSWYRKLEHHYALYDLEPGREDERLQEVMARVRADYTLTVEKEIECFSRSLAAGEYQVDGMQAQDGVFEAFVRPLLTSGKKTAYVLVDGMRYEMGLGLTEGLAGDFKIRLKPAVVQLPAITAVGVGCADARC